MLFGTLIAGTLCCSLAHSADALPAPAGDEQSASRSAAELELSVVLPSQTGRSLAWSPVGTRLEWTDEPPDDLPEPIRAFARDLIDPVFGSFALGPEHAAPRPFILARTTAHRAYRERLIIDAAGNDRIDPERDVFDAEARESRNRMWVTHSDVIIDINYGPAGGSGDEEHIIPHEFSFWHVYPREAETGEFNILRYSRRSWLEGIVELHGETFTVAVIDADNTARIGERDRWSLSRHDEVAERDHSDDDASPAGFTSDARMGVGLDEPFFIAGQAYRLSQVSASGTRAALRATDEVAATPEPDERSDRPQSEHTLAWGDDLAEAKQRAAREGMPVFVKWTAVWCGPCRQMDREAYRDKVVVDLLREHFVLVELDRDEAYRLADQLEIRGLPTMQIYNAEGAEHERRTGYHSPERLEAWLMLLIEQHEDAS